MKTQNDLNQNNQNRARQAQLKKLLPKGTCTLSDFTQYQNMQQFINRQQSHLYLTPTSSNLFPFVIIKTFPQSSNYPLYSMYYRPTKTFLLSAQQQALTIGCNYIICKAKNPQKNKAYVGKIRGNFNRNQFSIYDNGDNPDRLKFRNRKQLAYICRQQQSFWGKSQPRISMIVPRPQRNSRLIEEVNNLQPVQFQCSNSNPNPLLRQCKQSYNNSIQILQSKQPKEIGEKTQNKSSKSIELGSISNYQVIKAKKNSQTNYQIAIGSPLTILQGFGFLITLIQTQIL